MQHYFRWVLAHRASVLVICFLVTVLAGLGLSRAQLSSSLPKLLFGDDPEFQTYLERVREFGTDETLFIAFSRPHAESEAALAHLRGLVSDLAQVDDVARVHSILSLLPLVANAADPLEAAARLPLAQRLLVSEDQQHFAVVVELEPHGQTPLERAKGIADEVLDACEKNGLPQDQIHLGGMLAILAETQRQTELHLLGYTPVVALLLLLATYVLFQQLWPVTITLIVGGLTTVWTLGLAVAIDPEIHIMLAVCPSLILLIAFSDVVHLCTAYQDRLRHGQLRDVAILESATDVGRACWHTSITTFVSFLSLTLLPVPALRQMGLVLGFGVGVALILAMTLCPIFFSYTRATPPLSSSRLARLLDSIIDGLHRATTRHSLACIAGAIVVTLGLGSLLPQLDIEIDFHGRFPDSHPLVQAHDHITTHFTGSLPVELYVDLPTRDAAGTNLRPQLEQLHDELEQMPSVGKVLSWITWVRSLPPQQSTRASLAHDLPGLYRATDRRLRFTIFVDNSLAHAAHELGETASRRAQELLGPGTQAHATGFFKLGGTWLERNLRTQQNALWVTFATIALLLTWAFRSWRCAAWSMLPNMLPLVWTTGCAILLWPRIDSDAIVVALIAIGIAVDDTIHFVTRYRLELQRSDNIDEALATTFTLAGRAILKTSLIFAVGLAPLAFSSYLSVRMLGVLAPLAMIWALLADLILLPALIHRRWLRL